jgi:hypothetical protein
VAAIDLLFDTKKDSERLHQALLCVLLSRTRVLHNLLGLTDMEAVDFDWEPGRRPLEQVIYLRSGNGSRSRVFIEARVDYGISDDRLAEQLAYVMSDPRDRLVYLLLGYSRITTPRGELLYRIASTPQRPEAPPLLGRVAVCDAQELITLLSDPEVLPQEDTRLRRDSRDLCGAYRDVLQDLEGRTRRFAQRPVAAWETGDYLGFFDACRRRPATKQLQEASVSFISDDEGGYYACAWGYTSLGADTWLYLQFEDDRLCLKLEVGESQATVPRPLYERARSILRTLPVPAGLPPPVPTVFRPGRTMTFATFSGLLVDLETRWPLLCLQLEQIEGLAEQIAQAIGDTQPL